MLPRPPLSLALSGLTQDPDAPWSAGPRAVIEWAATIGVHSVQLDATTPGIRPRELDRSARRDLASLLRRSQLTLSGLDLWIPPEHFTDPARADRALTALHAAIELAAELSRLIDGSPSATVSLSLPTNLPPDAAAAIASDAQRHNTRIADHARQTTEPDSPIGVGLDPAALLLANLDPAAAAARAGQSLVSARLSDASTITRVQPGRGRLDQTAYVASLSVAGYSRPLVLNLRGLPDQAAAASSVIQSWPP